MKPTIPYIQERYQTFNQQCFGGELPLLPVRLSQARKFLGAIRFRKRRGLLGQVSYTDFVLHISVKFDIDEQELEDTILHEMIHFYILHKKIKDSSAHGPVFRRMMQDINERFGRHITISHRVSKDEYNSDQQPKPHILCVAELSDGTTVLTACARSRVFQLYSELPHHYSIARWTWYFTTNPFFNRFPNSITPKFYKVNQQDFQHHLVGAVELVCDGHTFKPRK